MQKPISSSIPSQCFVVMPSAGGGRQLYLASIKPTVEALGLSCVSVDDLAPDGNTLHQIVQKIHEATIVIVDVSGGDPDAFYQLGIANTLGTKVLVIAQDMSLSNELNHHNVIIYKTTLAGLREFQNTLNTAITLALIGPKATSPVVDAFPKSASVPGTEVAVLQNQLARLRTKLQIKNEELRERRLGTLVSPRWKGGPFKVEPDLCFLLMPFREEWSEGLWDKLKYVTLKCGYRCQRADENDGRVVMDDIWKGINTASVIIADLTAKNPNVTYEVGLADVLGKEVILLSQTEHVPFDFEGQRLIIYECSPAGLRALTDEVERKLQRCARGAEEARKDITRARSARGGRSRCS